MSMDDPATYLKNSATACNIVNTLLEEIKDRLNWNNGGERVMDVGCGPGNITAQILGASLPRKSTVIGTDISNEMVQFAQENFSNEFVSFRTLDICDTKSLSELNEKEFTKIYTFFCLHRVSNLRVALQNVYNLLQPGGELVAIVMLSCDWDIILRYLAKLDAYKNHAKNLLASSHDDNFINELTNLLKDVGFDITFNSIKNNSHCFETLDKSIEFLGSVSYLPSILPDCDIQQVMQYLRKNTEKVGILGKNENGYNYRYDYLRFIARKPIIV